MAQTTDPVCGMRIEMARAAGQSTFQNETYYFCSTKCKKAFDDEPEAYLMHVMGGGSMGGPSGLDPQ